MNLQVDRLSSLPDDLIHKILSFIDVKDAIQTGALSSRYRFIWTSLSYLNFSNDDFLKLPKFSKFVTHRDNQVEVYSVTLNFRGKISHVSVGSILNYAFSHNVQQMTVSNIDFPLSLFGSQSLKHLTLFGAKFWYGRYFNPTTIWELPALTTLHLTYITFNDNDLFTNLFSKCSNLKNLSLNYCKICRNIRGPIVVDICLPVLSNLTLEDGLNFKRVLNVVTPQLKNLSVRNWSVVHLTCAPKLDALVFKGYDILQYSPNYLCSLEKADLHYYQKDVLNESNAQKVVDLLQQIRSVKYLTLSMETIQLVSSFKELISHQPSPFANLRSLKVYPYNPSSKMEETMPIEVKNYLMESSSGATFTMVSCKEIIELGNVVYVQNQMAELRVILEDAKAYIKTNTSSPMENENTQHIAGGMAKIKFCLEDLGDQIDQGRKKTFKILRLWRDIEELLLDELLPTSKRDKLQACYSSLQAEVSTVVKKLIDRMKIQCDWTYELAMWP